MIEGYRKLLNDLEQHKRFITAFQSEYDYNKKLLDDNINNKPIDKILADLEHYKNLIYLENESKEKLEKNIKLIDECIDKSDIIVKVAQLRALGYSQEDVAELVHISDRHVRRIEAKLREG